MQSHFCHFYQPYNAKVNSIEGRVINLFLIIWVSMTCRKVTGVGRNLDLIVDIFFFFLNAKIEKASLPPPWEYECMVLASPIQFFRLVFYYSLLRWTQWLVNTHRKVSTETLPKTWRKWLREHPPGLLVGNKGESRRWSFSLYVSI